MMDNAEISIGKNCIISSDVKIGGRPFYFNQDKNGYYHNLTSNYKPVKIGDDVFVNPFVNIEFGVKRPTEIGNNTKIDSFVIIGHDVIIGKSVLVGTSSKILGGVKIGDYSRIGAGAVIHQKIKIGKNCIIGANSYLRHDVKDGEVWYGNPAVKITKTINYPKKEYY